MDYSAPTTAPEPAERFWRDFIQLVDYIDFPARLAKQSDKNREVARAALEDYYADVAEDAKREELAEAGEASALTKLRAFADLVFEMTLTRVVDNYLAFVAELLALIFRTRPEALRSGEQVRVDFVLAHSSMEELIDALTERRVERLTYAGFQALHDDVERDLGFRLFPSDDELREAVRSVEIRNLIVHNRAVVNRRFLNRVSDPDLQLGGRLRLEPDEVSDVMALLANATNRADAGAAEKWGLPRRSIDLSP